jgi:dehydrogenase/reductase SDR family protein 1
MADPRARGRGIAAAGDHRIDRDVEAVFRRVIAEQGALDILVNNAASYATGIRPPEDAPYWQLPVDVSDRMHEVGLRSNYIASIFPAREMVPRGSGLVVSVSSAGAMQYHGNVSYNVVR